MSDTGHVRQDKEGNIYVIPNNQIREFDNDCDEAVYAEPDEAIGLWIDIKTKFKKYIQE